MKKSLKTLIKLQKSYVEEQQQILARLQAHLDRVLNAIQELHMMCLREQLAVQKNPEMGLTYGAFVKRAIQMEEQLEKERISAEKAVELARDRLAQLFEEQKRYEVALDNREKEELREENRQERILLDEVGSISFTRHQDEETAR